MSYLTVEVEIDHGRIVAKESEKLPLKGSALLTILHADSPGNKLAERPIGLAKGKFVVPKDFNEPLPEEILKDFEGK